MDAKFMMKININIDTFKYIKVKYNFGGEFMAELPIAPVTIILKNAGAQRISDDAKIALTNVIEENAEVISKKAVKIAKHAGRKTIKAENIEMAIKV